MLFGANAYRCVPFRVLDAVGHVGTFLSCRRLLVVGKPGDLAPFLHLLVRVGRCPRAGKPGPARLLVLVSRILEEPRLGRLQGLDVALVLVEQGA